MKHIKNKNTADYFIKYDKNAPTSWLTLIILLVAMLWLGIMITNQWLENYMIDSENQIAEMRVASITEAIEAKAELKEQDRQTYLAELRDCESKGYDLAKGDGGDSNGPYQWQKSTLEDYLGRKISYEEYYSIVTDYDKIHSITYKTYFEKGESWRWKNCTAKINKQKTWNI